MTIAGTQAGEQHCRASPHVRAWRLLGARGEETKAGVSVGQQDIRVWGWTLGLQLSMLRGHLPQDGQASLEARSGTVQTWLLHSDIMGQEEARCGGPRGT